MHMELMGVFRETFVSVNICGVRWAAEKDELCIVCCCWCFFIVVPSLLTAWNNLFCCCVVWITRRDVYHSLIWSFTQSCTHTHTHMYRIIYAESKFVGWISSFVSFCHLTASGGRYLAKFKCTHLSSGIDFVSFPLRNASIWHGKHSKEEHQQPEQQLENLPITSSS